MFTRPVFSIRNYHSQIWLKLYDSVTGQQVSGPKGLQRKPGLNVDKFCEAVKEKFNYPNYLLDVPSSSLIVYKNKNDFDQRNAFKQKSKPLASSSLLNGLGETLEEALIVQIPSKTKTVDIDLNLNSRHNGEFLRYESLGDQLKTDPTVRNILTGVVDLDNSTEDELPFLFLEASSGMGKTQLAFTLKKALEEQDRRCIYLLAASPKMLSQTIYKAFDKVSTSFLDCIKNDIEGEEADALGVMDLEKKSLFVYDFIIKLVSQGYCGTTRVYQKAFGTAKQELTELIGKGKKPPVFILDEFPNLLRNSPQKLQLMRNCFRALGLPLLVMGTNSSAANLQVSVVMESREGEAFKWCSIYSKLPRILPSVLNVPPSPCFDILVNSRPWFAQKASKIVRKDFEEQLERLSVDQLEEVCTKVGQDAIAKKKIYDKIAGFRGQLCLFLNASYFNNNHSTASTIVNHHFANLMNDTEPFVMMTGSETVMPRVSFPPLSEDVLLYLCLTGLPGVPPFVDGKTKKAIPFIEAVRVFLNSDFYRSTVISFDNSAQTTNDGMQLEATLAAAICLASHVKGFRGCSFFQFMNQLIWELSGNHMNENLWNNHLDDSLLNLLSTIKIPFLAPPNQKWPDFLNIKDAHFGSYRRTCNMEGVDVSLDDVPICFEAKDYKSRIGMKTFKQVLGRITSDVKVHIVITNELQKSYFNSKKEKADSSFAAAFPGNAVPRTSLFRKYDCQTNTFGKIRGFSDPKHPERLVLFIEMKQQPKIQG